VPSLAHRKTLGTRTSGGWGNSAPNGSDVRLTVKPLSCMRPKRTKQRDAFRRADTRRSRSVAYGRMSASAVSWAAPRHACTRGRFCCSLSAASLGLQHVWQNLGADAAAVASCLFEECSLDNCGSRVRYSCRPRPEAATHRGLVRHRPCVSRQPTLEHRQVPGEQRELRAELAEASAAEGVLLLPLHGENAARAISPRAYS